MPDSHDHVYRAPMRSRLFDDDERDAVERALATGTVGVGGRLAEPPTDLDEAVERTRDQYDDRTADRLARFADIPVGAVVWTRDVDGLFHRGVVTGPWSYDPSCTARVVDLVHVRRCEWSPAPVEPPAAVLATFARGGRNFQRIRDA